MSKVVARMEKMKAGNLEGIQRHNQRETEKLPCRNKTSA